MAKGGSEVRGAKTQKLLPHVEGQEGGVAEYALDPESATRLWDLSEGLLVD